MVTAASLVRTVGVPVLLAKERVQSGVTYNLLSAAQRADPYPTYRRMRDRDPVHWSEIAQAWFLSRYDDVAAILRDPRFSVEGALEKSNKRMGVKWDKSRPFPRVSSKWMLMLDAPDHTRLRGLINKALTPKAVEAFKPMIQETADDLLDKVQAAGRMDAVKDFADPMPVIVFAKIMGLPPEQHEQFKLWANAVGQAIDPVYTPDKLDEIDRNVSESSDYFRGIIAERRQHPREDLLSALVAAEEQGDRLTEEELLATCILLLVAGTETTTNLIGNGIYAFMRNQDQYRRLKEDKTLIETAVEEILRYETPVQLTGRVAREDVPIGGKTIRTGQPVGLLMGSANRDPRQFTDPDRLDISREPNRQSAFSFGPHFCVGAPLARAEGQIAFSTIARRMPEIQLRTSTFQWRETFNNRGLSTLPVAF